MTKYFSKTSRFIPCRTRAAVRRRILSFLVPLWAFQLFAQERLDFIGVAPDQDYRAADAKLCQYLEAHGEVRFERMQPENYGAAIREVAERPRDGAPYVARMTPYACVAAEMLGAGFEILATYRSLATHSLTYHSYFVVNRTDFASPPTPQDLVDYFARAKSPRLFLYHDKFSTSSYFLPALFFRSQRIFAMQAPTEGLIAIQAEKAPSGKGSSYLVEQVAVGKADAAAVWDGTKTKYESNAELKAQYGDKVYFVQLPTALPNDLLVCSSWLAPAIKARLRKAIGEMKGSPAEAINTGDFVDWVDVNEAPDARESLAALRRLAAAPPAPVTVRIQPDPEGAANFPERYLEAARQAVRLSGTEFVLYDEDFHRHLDVTWTLRLIHDGAITLTSDIEGSGIEPQRFQISFQDEAEDLTKRIVSLINSRMHRIRYVWPYEDQYPVVIRDVAFFIPPGASVTVQKTTWIDPERNDFQEDSPFEATVVKSDFYRFQLNEARFPRAADGTRLAFDPMSNVAYRVVLVRPTTERPMFKILTIVFLVLLAGAAVGAIFDLRRSPTSEAATRRLSTPVN